MWWINLKKKLLQPEEDFRLKFKLEVEGEQRELQWKIELTQHKNKREVLCARCDLEDYNTFRGLEELFYDSRVLGACVKHHGVVAYDVADFLSTFRGRIRGSQARGGN